MSYSYVMDASFPNGEKDHLKGTIYLDNDAQRYYNDCDAFTMIYTAHWLYKADHRNKKLAINNLDKENNKKLKTATEKDVFQNAAAITFLDSVVLKTAVVKKMKHEGNLLKVLLGFPKSALVQQIEVVYNIATNLPVSYDMMVSHPWQRTPKWGQVVQTRIKCSDFKKPSDKSSYDESNFFSYNKGDIELKKYKNYKLTVNM